MITAHIDIALLFVLVALVAYTFYASRSTGMMKHFLVFLLFLMLWPFGHYMSLVGAPELHRVFITAAFIGIIGALFIAVAVLGKIRSSSVSQQPKRQVCFFLAGIGFLVVFLLIGAADWLGNAESGTYGEWISLGMLLSAACFFLTIHQYSDNRIVNLALHDVIHNMSMGVIVIDADDTVLEVNRIVQKYVKIAPGDTFLLEEYIQWFQVQTSKDEFIENWRKQPFKENTMEVQYVHNKREIQLLIKVAPILKEGRFLGRVVTLQNISGLRTVISELNEKNEALRRKNNELTKVQQDLAAANEKLERAAITDPLTGCYNRRYLNQILEDELRINLRYGIPFSIMLFDIDLFKSINDTYGHQVGDTVLIATANTVRATLRDSDILARYGGEEFTIYLPHTRTEDARMLAHRIRKAVEENAIPTPKGSVNVTISIGIAGMCQQRMENDVQETLYSLFSRADAALYRAKNAGRNQIVVSD